MTSLSHRRSYSLTAGQLYEKIFAVSPLPLEDRAESSKGDCMSRAGLGNSCRTAALNAGGVMKSSVVAALCVAAIALMLVPCIAGGGANSGSASWSAAIHEENSLVASVLYLPYMAAIIPYRFIEGILNPQPTSQSTVPPPAHRGPH